MELTRKRTEYLRCLHATWLETRRAPTYRGLAAHFGVAVTSAFELVQGLKRGGWLDDEMRLTARADEVIAGQAIAGHVWAELLKVIGEPRECGKCAQTMWEIKKLDGGWLWVDGATAKLHSCQIKKPKRRRRRTE